MEQTRGILFLADPLRAQSAAQMENRITNSMTLIFDENGHYLSLAQTALWKMCRRYSWVCVAAEGKAGCVGVALAAQLMVDRLVLIQSSLFMPRQRGMPRELARLEAYARRNLSLAVSEILLIDCCENEARGFLRGRGRGRMCALESKGKVDQNLLTAPWEQASRNNLLIPSECV